MRLGISSNLDNLYKISMSMISRLDLTLLVQYYFLYCFLFFLCNFYDVFEWNGAEDFLVDVWWWRKYSLTSLPTSMKATQFFNAFFLFPMTWYCSQKIKTLIGLMPATYNNSWVRENFLWNKFLSGFYVNVTESWAGGCVRFENHEHSKKLGAMCFSRLFPFLENGFTMATCRSKWDCYVHTIGSGYSVDKSRNV